MGAYGLCEVVDLTLTTSPEFVKWYEANNCKAIYWPLGSDPDFSIHENKKI